MAGTGEPGVEATGPTPDHGAARAGRDHPAVALALIAGMIPVALGHGEGGDFRAPLGRAVIGGTITSTFLTLLVIPTVYKIISGWREKARGFFRRRTQVRTEPAEEPGPAGG